MLEQALTVAIFYQKAMQLFDGIPLSMSRMPAISKRHLSCLISLHNLFNAIQIHLLSQQYKTVVE